MLKVTENRLTDCAVAAGDPYLDPAIASLAVGTSIKQPQSHIEPDETTDLSSREIAVLLLTALGHNNRTIATKLQIGVKGVNTYKARAMIKLGFKNPIEVVRLPINKAGSIS